MEAGWPERRFGEAQTVNIHVGRLRKALSVANCADVIRTVRSSGYMLDGSSQEQSHRQLDQPDGRPAASTAPWRKE
ncbi:helix-turn-helix domain-containing protein [Sinorhizobium meliloti]|uniref:helix-turn-helix domain-containing protein n=1 Tax=Rhizobium meliloti TaxID=382 RepID=UPI001F348658|nr:helix-turn-helix domain-containing protein [Sinorhizobium meliloti]MCO6426216.1 helix-turn-helix domain-containing protein [Sinorhizobium meliloti]